VYDCDGEIASASDEPVAIACGLTQPTFIALAGEDVYVTEHGIGYADGSLARIPKLGGLLERVVPAQLAPLAITASDDHVYWSNYGDDANGSLNRLSLADDSVDILASGLRYPWEIAVHDGSLYATESNNSRVLAARPNLSVEVLAEGQFIPTPLAVDDTGLFVGIQGESPPNDSPIRFIDHSGGQAELYTGVERAHFVLLDGNDLYFGTDEGLVRRGTRDGAPLVTLAGLGQCHVRRHHCRWLLVLHGPHGWLGRARPARRRRGGSARDGPGLSGGDRRGWGCDLLGEPGGWSGRAAREVRRTPPVDDAGSFGDRASCKARPSQWLHLRQAAQLAARVVA
jgi:hypothetical protein